MMVSPIALYRRLPHAPRRIRRLTVLAAYSGYPLLVVGYASLVEPERLPVPVWAPIAVVLMTMTIVGSFAIYGFVGDRLRSRADLDERERAMSDRALVTSYGVVTTALVSPSRPWRRRPHWAGRSWSRWRRSRRSSSRLASSCRCSRLLPAPGSSRTLRRMTMTDRRTRRPSVDDAVVAAG